jgi:predicted nucleotidyltransferase
VPENDFAGLLRALTASGVDFVLVGGTAAVLHGSSVATYDVDILMPFTPENCERLLSALGGLHPRLSHTPDKRPLTQSANELAGFKNLYLTTDLGQLDVLGSLHPIDDVQEVFDQSQWMDIGGTRVRVVSLQHLLTVKAAMGRPKDKLVEVELRAIAEHARHGSGEEE